MIDAKQVKSLQTFATDLGNRPLVRAFQLTHYTAIFRALSRPYALSHVFASAGRFQYATLYHPAGSTKNVYLRHMTVALENVSAVGVVTVDLVKLNVTTTPATGNPPIIPSAHVPGGSSTTSCLALPTTQGNEQGSPLASVEFNVSATGAAPTTNPPANLPEIALYDLDADTEPPTARLGNAEGFAIVVDVSAAMTVKLAYVRAVFSEE